MKAQNARYLKIALTTIPRQEFVRSPPSASLTSEWMGGGCYDAMIQAIAILQAIFIQMCTYTLRFFRLLSITSLRARTVRTNATKEVDRGSPSRHSRQGLGAMRAVCRAWGVLKVFFPAGVDKTISRSFLSGVVSYSHFFAHVGVFCSYVSR